MATTNALFSRNAPEAAVSAVARERHKHRRQRNGQRQAARDLDIDRVEQRDGRYQQLAPSDAHHGRDRADADPGDEPR